MPWISKEDVAKAKEMDLLTYLMNYRPDELKKTGGSEYGMKSHSSLKISNGKWIWYAGNKGGTTALNYLIEVEGMEFQDAVREIIGDVTVRAPVYIPKEELQPKKKFEPPAEGKAFQDIIYYLKDDRGIDLDIIYDEYNKANIYQTEKYKNVAFVGRDKEDNIRFVTLRGTSGSFKGTVGGSDRRYPYKIMSPTKRNSGVHIFEAPIDALSYATLMKQRGFNYKEHNFLSLCGVTPTKEDGSGKMPTAIDTYLKDYPYTDTVILHLDNDKAGRNATKVIVDTLSARGIKCYDQPPPEGYKDCNEYLLYGEPQLEKMMKQQQEKKMEHVRADR